MCRLRVGSPLLYILFSFVSDTGDVGLGLLLKIKMQ